MKHYRLLVMAIILVLFTRLVVDVQKLSFTSDEPSHIASGYAFLAEQATWTIEHRGHPLLIDAWLALPVYLGDPTIPITELDGWEQDNTRFVQAFTPYIQQHAERTELASRLPIILLTVLLAAVTARWARDIGGRLGTILALLVLASDPTLLGHGMLATNDVGVTVLGTTGLYLTTRFLRRKNLRCLIASGVILGATALAKGSGVVWLAGAFLMLLCNSLKRGFKWQRISTNLKSSVVLAVSAGMCIWAFYGFDITDVTLMGQQIPLPAGTHWKGILMQSGGAEARWTYFLGKVQRGGTWSYFPVSALLKNPIPMLILAAWGAIKSIFRQRTEISELWIFPVVYACVAVLSAVNIGYRHMIPLHPFAYLLIAGLAWNTRRISTYLVGPLLAILCIESILTAPYFISYFSPVVGGPLEGWRFLADSNTDWGQSYKALSAYQEQTGIESVAFSGPEGYIGVATYGVRHKPLPPISSNPAPIWQPWLQPAPDTYVISANSLSGLGMIAPDNYSWFRYHEPTTVIADTLFVYEIPSSDPPTWLAQCSTPVIPLDATTIEAAFDRAPSRQLTFDCTQAWVYPAQQYATGWYALHDQQFEDSRLLQEQLGLTPPAAREAFTARRLSTLSVSYRQWDYRETPPYVVYESSREATAYPELDQAMIGPAGPPPLPGESSIDLPVHLAGPITFLGASAFRQTDDLQIETWWCVEEGDITTPISIMAHLIAPDGAQIGIADGLGVAISELRPGDIIVQSHSFPAVEDPEALWLRTGIYDLDTTRLWDVATEHANAIFIPVSEAIIR